MTPAVSLIIAPVRDLVFVVYVVDVLVVTGLVAHDRRARTGCDVNVVEVGMPPAQSFIIGPIRDLVFVVYVEDILATRVLVHHDRRAGVDQCPIYCWWVAPVVDESQLFGGRSPRLHPSCVV